MPLVVLLRGVNVGGHRTFRPSELAKELAEFDVVNIGAAGTLVVRGRVAEARLRTELARRLPFETEVAVCRGQDVLDLVASDPFRAYPARPDVVRFVSVLAREPANLPSLPMAFPARGAWQMRLLARERRFVLGMYRRVMKAVSHLGQVDRLYGVPATTRNWNTVGAIARVLQGQ